MADDQAPWWTRPPEPSGSASTRTTEAGPGGDTADQDPATDVRDRVTRADRDEVEVLSAPGPADREWTDRDDPVDRTELMDLTGRPEREDRAAAAEAFGVEAFDGTGSSPYEPVTGHDDEARTEALTESEPGTEVLREPATEALPDYDLPFGAGPPQPGVRRTVAPSPALDPPVKDWGEPEYGEGVFGWEEPAERPVPPPGPATEQLPAVPVDEQASSGPDTLGVYGAPSDVAPGIPGLSADADPVGHLRDDAPRRQLPLPGGLPGGPKLLAVAGGVLAVLVVVLLVRGLTGGGGDDDPADEAAQAGATSSQDTAGGPPAVSRLGAAQATSVLKKVQQTGTGQVVGAWTWDDDNGENMLVTLRKPKGDDDVDLRVVLVSKLETDKPQVLRVMQEPNVPNCEGAGAAAFTKDSVQVRDVDKDGVGEVTVGWTARCGGKGAQSVAKLALLTNDDKYILRGEGVLGESGSGGTTPDPKSSDWPEGFLEPLTDQFRKLYF